MLQPHILFIGNLAAHWVYLMSGIASVIVALWETVRKKPLLAKGFWAVALVALLASCDRAWQDERRNTEAVIAEKSAMASLYEECRTSAKIEEAYKKGLEISGLSSRQTIDRQQRMNDKQANDISGCLLVLGKMNPRITEEIRVVPILFEARDALTHKPVTNATAPGHTNVEYTSIVLITTNQNESRFHGILDCSSPFELATMPELSATGVTDSHASFSGIQPEKKSWHSYELRVPLLDKEWSPNNPAWVLVRSPFRELGFCTFVTQ